MRSIPFFVVAVIILSSCSTSKAIRTTAQPGNHGEPDYRNMDAWAAHPSKADPSDKLPSIVKKDYEIDTNAVVFFVHPTTLTDDQKPEWNANLSDIALNKETDDKPIKYQASAFNEYPVYAPRYRQAHIKSYYTDDTAQARQAFDLAYSDVRNSFIQFLQEAHGRAVILASHSQGSTHMIRLLKEFFDSSELQKQLVAAYVIGMRIPDDFKTLRMCSDSSETGCLVGWRTFREGYIPGYIEKETGSPMITNPLTWTLLDNEQAPANLNRGAVLTKFEKVFPKAADARIHDRILWVSQLNFPGSFLVNKKNLHVGDINLFWMNIRENCSTRVRNYHRD